MDRGVASIGNKELKKVAMDCGERLGVTGFKASESWIKRWKGRCNLGARPARKRNQIPDNAHQNGNQTVMCFLTSDVSRTSSVIQPYQLSPLNSTEEVGLEEMGVASCPVAKKPEKGDYYFDYNTPEHNYSMSHDIATPTSLKEPHLTSFHNHIANMLEGVAFLQSHRAGRVGLELTLGEEVGVVTPGVEVDGVEKEVLSNDSESVLNQHIISRVPEFPPRASPAPSRFTGDRHILPDFAGASHTSPDIAHALPSELTAADTHFPSEDHTSLEFSGNSHAPSDFPSLDHTPPLLQEDNNLMMAMFNHRPFTDSFPFLLLGTNWLSPSDIVHSSGETTLTTPTSINEVGVNERKAGDVMSSLDSSFKSPYQTRSATRAGSTAIPTTLFETPPPGGMVRVSSAGGGGGGGGMLANRISQPVFPDEPEIIFHEIQLGPLHTTPLL